MFKEILFIKPQLDQRDLKKMDSQLTRRFSNIAKKFGRGLKNIILGGGVFGTISALVSKFLNPLQEVKNSLDAYLNKTDDLSTNAKLFNTTAGQLAKIQAMGEATGLDTQALFQMMERFRIAIAEARLDPEKDSAVSLYRMDEDLGKSFVEFISQLSKMSPTEQAIVQKEVFGSRQTLKAAEFLQRAEELDNFFKKFSEQDLTKSIEKGANLKDLADLMAAERGLSDISEKSKRVNASVIKARERGESEILKKENERLGSFQDLQKMQINIDKIAYDFERLMTMSVSLLSEATMAIEEIVVESKKASGFLSNVKSFLDSIREGGSRFFRLGKEKTDW